MTNDCPKITVITPSYNQGQFIEQTIKSVLDQNYPNLEYIIIDGGSTDNSVDIIKKHENQLAYWISEKDKGQSHAINKGLQKATGDIINWLNSDDYYEPGCLHTVAKEYQKNKKINAVLGVTRVIGKEKEEFSQTPFSKDLKYTFSKAKIEQPATFISGSFFRKHGPLNEDLHLAMDLDLWVKFLLTYNFENIVETDNILVNFREHENSKTVNNREKMVVERAQVIQEIIDGINEKKGRYKEIVKSLSLIDKSNIVAGCLDFQLFWYNYFCNNNSTIQYSLKELKQKNTSFLNFTRRIISRIFS